MTFWDHLEELRHRLLLILGGLLVASVACFCFKDVLFAVVMHPKPQSMALINTELTQQLLIHMRIALWGGLLIVSPLILYQLFAFIAPGLYAAERAAAVKAVGSAYLLFLAGVALNYFLLFPITVRFLNGYNVNPQVHNTITLSSYISVLGTMSLLMGAAFELPVLCWLLAKMHLLEAQAMRRYRRHALVAILILAAVITPTGDPFTMLMVSLPVYLLWELSIAIVKHTNPCTIES